MTQQIQVLPKIWKQTKTFLYTNAHSSIIQNS